MIIHVFYIYISVCVYSMLTVSFQLTILTVAHMYLWANMKYIHTVKKCLRFEGDAATILFQGTAT